MAFLHALCQCPIAHRPVKFSSTIAANSVQTAHYQPVDLQPFLAADLCQLAYWPPAIAACYDWSIVAHNFMMIPWAGLGRSDPPFLRRVQCHAPKLIVAIMF